MCRVVILSIIAILFLGILAWQWSERQSTARNPALSQSSQSLSDKSEEKAFNDPGEQKVSSKPEEQKQEETLKKDLFEKTRVGNVAEKKTSSFKKQVEKKPEGKKEPVLEKHDGISEGKVNLWVTRDFGQKVIFNQQVGLKKGESVLEVTKRYLQVETAYGGEFIQAIDGLAGSSKSDWFYYVNGTLAAVGAGDYYPLSGDTIWWDYHEWESKTFIPAAVGSYPAPFLYSYNRRSKGGLVFYPPGREEQARALKVGLLSSGLSAVKMAQLEEEKISTRRQPALILGTWEELSQNKMIKALFTNNKKTGICIQFEENGVAACTPEGKAKATYGSGSGAIVVSAAGLGDPFPLWIIAGVDEAGLENTMRILLDQPEKLRHCFGIVVSGDKVIPVPVLN